jgi:hypothetical protein
VTYAATTDMPLCRRLRYAYPGRGRVRYDVVMADKLVLRFGGSNHIHASINLVLRSAHAQTSLRSLRKLDCGARVSKDGHKRHRASGHPSRRRFAPPQDEVCVCLSSIEAAAAVSSRAPTALGSRIVNVEPRPGSLSTMMSPPII